MKSLRLAEVLLPLLAARGWAPWPIEPGVRIAKVRGLTSETPPPGRLKEQQRHTRPVPFDDVQ